MIKAIRFMIITGFSVLVLACSATQTSESTGEYIDSTTVTAKVKAQLIDSLGAKAFKINVKTFKDEVQLSGFVNTSKLKERAGVIAASVGDVKTVRNNLIVK